MKKYLSILFTVLISGCAPKTNNIVPVRFSPPESIRTCPLMEGIHCNEDGTNYFIEPLGDKMLSGKVLDKNNNPSSDVKIVVKNITSSEKIQDQETFTSNDGTYILRVQTYKNDKIEIIASKGELKSSKIITISIYDIINNIDFTI